MTTKRKEEIVRFALNYLKANHDALESLSNEDVSNLELERELEELCEGVNTYRVMFVKSYSKRYDDEMFDVYGVSIVRADSNKEAREKASTYLSTTLHPSVTWGTFPNSDSYEYVDFTYKIKSVTKE